MGAHLAAVDTAAAEKGAARESTLPTGEALDLAVEAAKEWRRDAATVVAVTPGLSLRGVRLGTGSSVAMLLQSIRVLLPVVANPKAKGSGGGPSMRAAGQKTLAALEKARDAHRTALARLSPAARALAALKGILYEELKRVGRVARNVARGKSSEFAVSRHVRGGGGRRKAKKGEGASREGAGGTPGASTLGT
ncbi:MAG: hypothetical protein HY720_26965 [Planctomycetes bacterium]|nr:hypothetical protein [Planctomycetota bacterium]